MCCVEFEPLRQDGSQPAKGRRQYAGQPTVDSRRWSVAKSNPRNQESSKNTAYIYLDICILYRLDKITVSIIQPCDIQYCYA